MRRTFQTRSTLNFRDLAPARAGRSTHQVVLCPVPRDDQIIWTSRVRKEVKRVIGKMDFRLKKGVTLDPCKDCKEFFVTMCHSFVQNPDNYTKRRVVLGNTVP